MHNSLIPSDPLIYAQLSKTPSRHGVIVICNSTAVIDVFSVIAILIDESFSKVIVTYPKVTDTLPLHLHLLNIDF